MALSIGRRKELIDGLVRRSKRTGLYQSADFLAETIDEAVRARLVQHRRPLERIESQLRRLMDDELLEGLAHPSLIAWLEAAARQMSNPRDEKYFLEVRDEVAAAYGCSVTRAARVAGDDEDGHEAEDEDEDDKVPDGEKIYVSAYVFARDAEASEPFYLDEDSECYLELTADDFVTVAILSEAEFQSWQGSRFKISGLTDRAIGYVEDEMFMSGEQLDIELPDDADEIDPWRIVVVHESDEAVEVDLTLTIA